MWPELDSDEIEFKRTIRKFARERVSPLAAARDRDGNDPSDVLEELGKLGALGITVPTRYGGLGLDRRYLIIAIEELAYADASVAGVFSGHYLGMQGFEMFANEVLKESYLIPMARGTSRAAFALTEADAGSDISAMKSRAVLGADGWRLDGTKMFISSARESDVLILFAKTDLNAGFDGISAFAVPSNASGISYSQPLKKMGARGEHAYEVNLDHVLIPEQFLIGEVGKGGQVAMGVLNRSRIDAAAGANGIAMRALDLAVNYAATRNQFGGPISKFQSIQLMLGQMDALVSAGRAVTYSAADVPENDPSIRRSASIAKYIATENAFTAVDLALQIHGGYGYMQEYEIERLYRDVRVRRIFEGTSQIQLLTIAKTLLKNQTTGHSLN